MLSMSAVGPVAEPENSGVQRIATQISPAWRTVGGVGSSKQLLTSSHEGQVATGTNYDQ